MGKEVLNQILQKIKDYQKIIITRHIRPDGDCVGSTLGLKYLLQETFKDKDIRVINEDYVEYLKFLGEEDQQAFANFFKPFATSQV